MKKLFLILLLLNIHFFLRAQCLQVNVGVIIDTAANACDGPITLDAKHPGATYKWSTGANTQKIVVTKTDTFIVSVDLNGCVGTDTVTVTFDDPPIVDLGPDTTTECGACINLNAGNGGERYKWSNGLACKEFRWCQRGTTKFWVDVYSKSGCKSSDTIIVTINDGIPVDLGPDTVSCGSPVTIKTDHLFNSYLWNTGATTPTITTDTSGKFVVEVTDIAGCTGVDTINVIIQTPPVVNLTADTNNICGGCIKLKADNASLKYSWNVSTSIESSIQYCDVSSNKLITVTGTDSVGCPATDSVRVTITKGLDPDLGPDKTQCGGSLILDPKITGVTYIWNDEPLINNSTLHVSKSGTYWVEVKNANGCKGQDTINVTINDIPSFSLGPNIPSQCGGCVSLSANVPSATKFEWSTGEKSSVITYCKEGKNNVWARITAANGCKASDTIQINILSGYKVNLGSDTSQCGGAIVLNAGFTGASYLWSTGETTSQITVSKTGVYEVQIFNLPGCSKNDTISGSKSVNFTPELPAPSDIEDLSTNCLERELKVSDVPGATTFEWQIPTGWTFVSGEGTNHVVIRPPSDETQGKVSVIAKNQFGCASAAKETIVSVPDLDLFIPNTFTPNGDGINDVWVIRNINLFPNNELIVINRWGNEVFRTKGYNSNWTGDKLNEGTYFYKLTFQGCSGEQTKNGTITILR